MEGDTYQLSEVQVKRDPRLRLHRLTALGRDEIGDELKELAAEIEEYLAILGDRVKLYAVMREELEAVDREFSTPRLCEIAPSWDGLDDEDLMEREEMVVTVTMAAISSAPRSPPSARRTAAARAARAWRPRTRTPSPNCS
jgi:DNA gyrase subunit A